jgi:hypothetical protein
MKIKHPINLKFLVKLEKKTPTETKRQSLLGKTPTSQRMKKARMSNSQVKVMVIGFFNIRGVIMIEWVPKGQTFNQKYCVEVLTKLGE